MADEIPAFPAAREHVIREVVDFARRLRADGVSVPVNAALPAVEALGVVGLDDRERVRAAMQATLVTDARDRPVFDEHFPAFWYRLRTGLEGIATEDDLGDRAADVSDHDRGPRADVEVDVEGSLDSTAIDATLDVDGDPAEGAGEVQTRRAAEREAADVVDEAPDQRPGTYSPAGTRTPVGEESDDGHVDVGTIRQFTQALATLPGRRWRRSRSGPAVDARSALRESLDTGGVAISLPRRDRGRAAVRVCVLVDVSRSVLDAIDRAFLLSFLDGLVDEARSVRVFFFDTAIRDVTDVFASGGDDPASALERAEVAWGGGTRIGASLGTLRARWPRAVDRRTVTLVVSDGLEVGDITDLEANLSWVARRSSALLWLNPLATSVSYEPTCRGMAAARQYVDGLFAFGGTSDVVEVARQLERRGAGGPLGFEFDFRDRRQSAAGG